MDFNKVGVRSLHYKLVSSLRNAILASVIFIGPLILVFTATENGKVLGIVGALVEVAFFFMIGAIGSLLAYKATGFKIEDNSLKLQQGLFSVRTDTIPFNKITNVSYNQSFLQRYFGVGQVDIDQEDSEITWKDIDRETANKVINAISTKAHIQSIEVK